MKVYVAGPMRGYENYNFDAFDVACHELKKQGHIPISPADIDRLFEGWCSYPPKGAVFDKGDAIRFIRRDIEAIIYADAIYMLQGWEDSTGARLEFAMAEFLGLEIMYEK